MPAFRCSMKKQKYTDKEKLRMIKNKQIDEAMLPETSSGFANCPEQPVMKEFKMYHLEDMFGECENE